MGDWRPVALVVKMRGNPNAVVTDLIEDGSSDFAAMSARVRSLFSTSSGGGSLRATVGGILMYFPARAIESVGVLTQEQRAGLVTS